MNGIGFWIVRAGLFALLSVGSFLGAQGNVPQKIGLPDQKIRIGDSLSVAVLEEGSISGAFKVRGDGSINYPFIGRLEVAGLTAAEIATSIESFLEADYIRDAIVSVSMIDRQQDSVFIYGAVRRQGGVGFDSGEGITLGKAIAMVGGVVESADKAKVKIERAQGNKIDSLLVDLNKQSDFMLETGDIVMVASKPEVIRQKVMERVEEEVPAKIPMGRVVVGGQVNRPGIIEVPIEGGADILEVIALSGDFTRLARQSKVLVRRLEQDGSYKSLTVDVAKMRKANGVDGFRIYAGDTIYVEESRF